LNQKAASIQIMKKLSEAPEGNPVELCLLIVDPSLEKIHWKATEIN
jgi:hypothetical protein